MSGRRYCIRFDGQGGTANKGGTPSPSAAAASVRLGGDLALLCAKNKALFVVRTQVRKAFKENKTKQN